VSANHVIVLPGGGYSYLSENEGPTIVAWLSGLGLSASEFRYPVATGDPGVREAIHGEIRARRAAGADRIALIGFSAGGHAAGHAALTARDPAEQVDLAILCYPVVSMLLPTHQGSREQLIGLDAGYERRAATSLERLVTASAPPFFIWHTAADEPVPVEHSYRLGQALASAGVRHELHVFADGVHGLNLARGQGQAEQWTALCATWLRAEGWL
jgi:acetyl esterase/lipase